MNELRRHAIGILAIGLTTQNDMIIVSDWSNNQLRWYDAEMNELRRHALGYQPNGICTQN